MNTNTESFIKIIKHPVKFRMFLFSKLPSAYFAGLRIKEMDVEHCTVSVPYKWFSKNPFSSTYFACLSMAAEMSTGALAMAHIYKMTPAVSMLVLKVESSYLKKAVGRTVFTCNDGLAIQQAIESAIETGNSTTVIANSTGRNEKSEIIAEFFITWSFKNKSS